MASRQAAKQVTPAPVQEATQESRATAIWAAKASKEALQASLIAETDKRFAARLKPIQDAYNAIQKEISEWLAARPEQVVLKDLDEKMATLKAQLIQNRQPTDEKTLTLEDGNQVQFRNKDSIEIEDGKLLAKALMTQKLWETMGTQISIDTKLSMPLAEKGALPGVKVVRGYTVAMVARKD